MRLAFWRRAKGASFGRYRLLGQIATGGMGVVYRAVVDGPQGFRRQVVIKRIRPGSSDDETFVSSFVTEARLAARLNHPNIVQVFDFGEVDHEYFLAMEYIDGVDLNHLIKACRKRRHPIPVALVCYIVSEAAAALHHAHSLRDDDGHSLELVHRDVSPSNVMLTTSGRVKLLDFGVAKAADRARAQATGTGTLKGKLPYMSPEQAEALPIDRRSDVFALGAVMFESLQLVPLFRGETEIHTLRLVQRAQVSPPSRQRAEIPPELDAIVLKMLARDREQRYQSAEEVVNALAPLVHDLRGDAEGLRRFLAEILPDIAGAKSAGEAAEALATGATQLSGEVEKVTRRLEPQQQRWRRRLLPVAAVAVLAAGIVVWRRPPPPPPAERKSVAVPSPPPVVVPVATPPAPTVTPIPPVAAEPAVPLAGTVSLAVRGTRRAEILVDGTAVGRVPAKVSLPRRPGTRTVAVRLQGFVSFSTKVEADQDAVVMATLPKLPHRRSGRPPSGPIKDPFSR